MLVAEGADLPRPTITDQFATDLNAGEDLAYHVTKPMQQHMRWDFEPSTRLEVTASFIITADNLP
jgi:hypothetical protein